jgi:hypothetical protein
MHTSEYRVERMCFLKKNKKKFATQKISKMEFGSEFGSWFWVLVLVRSSWFLVPGRNGARERDAGRAMGMGRICFDTHPGRKCLLGKRSDGSVS